GKFPVPPALLPPDLDPEPDTRFIQSGANGRTAGGWFALDGVHPTTIGYGMVAQEIIRIMHQYAGVEVYDSKGAVRSNPEIDFAALRDSDSLISDPPQTLSSVLDIVGNLNEKVDFLASLIGRRGL